TFVTGSEHDTNASGSTSLVQQFQFGSASVHYDRSVAVAGGLGGPTENQTVGGTLRMLLQRDLTVDFSPAYTMTKSIGNAGIDVKALTVVVRAAYQVTPWLSALASYNFFRQRTENSLTAAGLVVNDVDQNRVFLGLQFGYPIRSE